eukprot:15453488-Alexandrium_andersonii.AAC.1
MAAGVQSQSPRFLGARLQGATQSAAWRRGCSGENRTGTRSCVPGGGASKLQPGCRPRCNQDTV